MYQNTYDMKTSENNTISNLNNENNKEIKYTNSKIGKENPNSLAYKLNQIREAQNKLKLNNDSYAGNHTLANALDNNKITNQNKYSKYKQIPTSNNYINNNNNINTNENHSSSRKSSSRQKQTSSTAQIDEQYEMQKLLELENKNYENKFKDVVYKKLKDKDNNLNSSNNSISIKNNIPVNNNSYYNNINKSGYKKNLNIINEKENEIDKDIKNYIDEQAEKIKEFVHEEINNLHVDLIRQFEIQNSQNLKMMQEFSLLNKQLYQEILKLKNENNMLKNNFNNND
jgi:protein NEDD1